MRVKQLQLVGFKSFATPTTIHFEPGVTALVGPNGSGKSNLVDSIRWVLGEHNPRDVRAPRLEDVIFNGTDTKAPLSMAEVRLTIDNDRGMLPIAFTELAITRRVYRSGESEYLINNAPCRLKDIQELLFGDGPAKLQKLLAFWIQEHGGGPGSDLILLGEVSSLIRVHKDAHVMTI